MSPARGLVIRSRLWACMRNSWATLSVAAAGGVEHRHAEAESSGVDAEVGELSPLVGQHLEGQGAEAGPWGRTVVISGSSLAGLCPAQRRCLQGGGEDNRPTASRRGWIPLLRSAAPRRTGKRRQAMVPRAQGLLQPLSVHPVPLQEVGQYRVVEVGGCLDQLQAAPPELPRSGPGGPARACTVRP